MITFLLQEKLESWVVTENIRDLFTASHHCSAHRKSQCCSYNSVAFHVYHHTTAFYFFPYCQCMPIMSEQKRKRKVNLNVVIHSEVWIIFSSERVKRVTTQWHWLCWKGAVGIDRSRASTHHNIPNSQESNSEKSPEDLKENIPSQQNFLYKIKEENDVSLQVAYLLATQSCLLIDRECLQQQSKCV